MTKDASPLNASTITLSVIPECLYQESKLFKGKNLWIPVSSSPRQSLSRGPWFKKPKKKQKRGFPIKDFGNDG